MKYFLDSIFYSYAQILFSNRKWFGAVILFATFVHPLLGLAALLGVIISNLMAVLLKFDKEKIRSGIYGFNGILFGAATMFYYQLNIQLLIIIPIFFVITFFISVVLEHHLGDVFNLPGLSLPFIISIYIFAIFLTNYNSIQSNPLSQDNYISGNVIPPLVENYFRSLSLIIFQPGIISGIIIFLALIFFSRVLFILSLIAFVFNSLFLQLILPQQYDSLLILTGFNSILTAFALGGSLIIPSRKSIFLVVAAILMVIILTGFFSKILGYFYLPILVTPFNFIVLSTIYSLKFREKHTDFVLLYFKPGSPEENYYYHKKRKSRFEKFKLVLPELPFFGEWFVSQGFEGAYTHKDDWKYAWDFVVVDSELSNYSGSGKSLEDYYCYNLPVIAPLDGEVVKVVNGISENKIGCINLNQNWGNTVVLSHQYNLYSSLSHLKTDSIIVKEGDRIKKGDVIGNCGNSGRSPSPHLHFQFQLSDKLGDKTYKFPFANFIAKDDKSLKLKSFEFPSENTLLQNIDIHSKIKKAFEFKLGEKLNFEFERDGKKVKEKWEVKVDIQNQMYIESSLEARADIFITEKVFYFVSYIGEKNTALYYFYLLSMRVPFCFHENLEWEDEYSIAQLPIGFIRYLSELFIFYKDFIKAKGVFNFKLNEKTKNYEIISRIIIKGESIFKFVSKEISGKVIVDENGSIESFVLTEDENQKFKATQIIESK